jgi:hypothetical protein
LGPAPKPSKPPSHRGRPHFNQFSIFRCRECGWWSFIRASSATDDRSLTCASSRGQRWSRAYASAWPPSDGVMLSAIVVGYTRLRTCDRGGDPTTDSCAHALRARERARSHLRAVHVGRLGDQHRDRRVVLKEKADRPGGPASSQFGVLFTGSRGSLAWPGQPLRPPAELKTMETDTLVGD